MVKKGIIPGLYRLNSGSRDMAKNPLSLLIQKEEKGLFRVSPAHKYSPKKVTIGEILESKGIRL